MLAAFAVLFPVMAQDATPEGRTYDAINDRFIFGSITQGTVFTASDSGGVTPFIQDKALMGTFGMRADANYDRLYVTNADPSPYFGPTGNGNMMLGIYDLSTGDLIYMVDLNKVAPEGRQADNDVTFDKDGDIYVTDSFSPMLYKVDSESNASVFVTDAQFSSTSIGLNGIAYDADGYLIVSNLGAGKQFKVPVDDPKSFTEIALEKPISVDGKVLAPDGSLLVVGAQADQMLYKLTTNDDWKSAMVAATFKASQLITAVKLEGNEPYVLYTSFDANPPPGSYQIVPVGFSNS